MTLRCPKQIAAAATDLANRIDPEATKPQNLLNEIPHGNHSYLDRTANYQSLGYALQGVWTRK